MTNEEKALELFPDRPTLECMCKGVREKLVEMAEWKDEQYRKEFNVPDYCKTFEDIVYYIGHDVHAKGYNKAKAYDKKWLKEFLEKKQSVSKGTLEIHQDNETMYYSSTRKQETICRNLELELSLINEIINELFGETE